MHTLFLFFLLLVGSLSGMSLDPLAYDNQSEDAWQEDAKKLQDAYILKKKSVHYQNAIKYHNKVTKIRDIINLHSTNDAIIFLANHNISHMSMPSLLARAARKGYTPFCAFLLDTPELMPPDAVDTTHALHKAVASSNLKTATFLLQRGASAEKRDASQRSPLDYACMNRDPQAIALLMHHIDNINDITLAFSSLLEGSGALGYTTEPVHFQRIKTCANLLIQKRESLNFFARVKKNKLLCLDYIRRDYWVTKCLFALGFSLESQEPHTQKTIMHYIAPRVDEHYSSKEKPFINRLTFLLREQEYAKETAVAVTLLCIHKKRKNDAPHFGRIPKDVLKYYILPQLMPIKYKNHIEYRPQLLTLWQRVLTIKDAHGKTAADYLPNKCSQNRRDLFNPEKITLHNLGLE